ncbi:MPT63 family protein [Mycobacterium sp. 21AC1]|uniref:MPT63 family protein n=1 Tax=[Mycobacterium] appelbergii TaxID=2939269 RepID=UPI002938E08A|nr:MPT63 family protein [Mycobacterium sp. 21AC1]MDV3125692.1 MPT63 family protein [Mycobacterium sp. 21AC1]
MNISRLTAVFAAGVAVAGAAGTIGAATAFAEADAGAAPTSPIGSQAKLADGNVVQAWTINDLKPSTDTIPYRVQGTLWEATATDEALEGSATPIVSNLNARAADGQNYRVLFQVATPQGVNPATLAQGQKTTGKVYFDVTGEKPTSVVYSTGDQDLLTWVESAAPAPRQVPARQAPARTAPAPAVTAPAPVATPAPAANIPAPAANAPVPVGAGAGTRATDLPAGQGAPLPTGSQGTPLPADAPVPVGAEAAPAPGGSQGTPVPAGVEAAPAPGAPAPAPAAPPAGSEAPLTAGGIPTLVPAANPGTPTP